MDERLRREIEHHRMLAAAGAAEVWAWETAAGRRRWARRAAMLTEGLSAGRRVLELGCGMGHFTRELAKTGASVVAVDISEELLAQARTAETTGLVEFRRENAYELTLPDASFDAVVGSSVLHHLDLGRALAESFRVLRPGGFVRFSEPNMLNPQIALTKNVPWIKARMGDSPDETAFFRGPLKRAFRAAGFVDVTVEPYDFLHPRLPAALVPAAEGFCAALERVPLVREIAGSLFARAAKPR